MPKQIQYTLTETEVSQVEEAIGHDPRPEVVRRATAIRLLHQGHTPIEAAHIVAASRASVQNWDRAWGEGGLHGLANNPIPGRKPKANQTYQAALDQTLETDPHELGYAFSVWTLERLSQHLEQVTGIALSVGRLAEWMERWGYVFRRPKPDLSHKQDPEVRQQVQTWLEEVKKQPKTGFVGFSLWTKPPIQPRIPNQSLDETRSPENLSSPYRQAGVPLILGLFGPLSLSSPALVQNPLHIGAASADCE